jgi:hypothetical protein
LSTGQHQVAAADHRSLAQSLVPRLREACDGRLGDVRWFKADWQRGGAATGRATWLGDEGELDVIIKLPVGQRELLWTRRLQAPDDPDPVVPRLYAFGTTLADYDLAWVVIEHFEHGPLGLRWHKGHVGRIAEALARFHACASAYPVNLPPRVEAWDEQLQEARESVRTNRIEEHARWTQAIKKLQPRLGDLVHDWRARPISDWLHGDAHIANAMSRHGMDEGGVSLIDLAEVHAGHWVEDALYLERQLWARPERLKPVKPVKALANARRRLGLPVDQGYPRLAMIRRALLAATAPKYIRSEGNPKHMAACLTWLETALKEL